MDGVNVMRGVGVIVGIWVGRGVLDGVNVILVVRVMVGMLVDRSVFVGDGVLEVPRVPVGAGTGVLEGSVMHSPVA